MVWENDLGKSSSLFVPVYPKIGPELLRMTLSHEGGLGLGRRYGRWVDSGICEAASIELTRLREDTVQRRTKFKKNVKERDLNARDSGGGKVVEKLIGGY